MLQGSSRDEFPFLSSLGELSVPQRSRLLMRLELLFDGRTAI